MTRKVAHGAASISLGLADELVLGDLDARRDWGYAPDYVRAMWLMLQQDQPGDYVVASGVLHSVRELVTCAFEHTGLDWERHVRMDDSLKCGAAELHDLTGESGKARALLGWSASMVGVLVDAELERLQAIATETLRLEQTFRG